MIAFRVSRPRRTFCAFVCPQSRPTRLMQTDPYYPASASDKPSYVADGLALRNEMRPWGVVRQGGVPGTGIIGTSEGLHMGVVKARVCNTNQGTPHGVWGAGASAVP